MTYKLPTLEENISALMDGELNPTIRQRCYESLLSEPRGLQVWHVYHMVGDVLRSDGLANGHDGLSFLRKLETRLSVEAIEIPAAIPVVGSQLNIPVGRSVSANADWFRWPMAVGGVFAVVVAFVAGGALQQQMPQQNMPLASAISNQPGSTGAPLTQTPGQDLMIRDARLDQLLSAHHQIGGHSALQMPSGFLRNATFDGKGR